MRNNIDYDLRMCCLDYNLPTKGTGKKMNRQSFRTNVINSAEFQSNLKNRKVIGMYTHKGRYFENLDKNIPYLDNISVNPLTANFCVDLFEENDRIIVDLKLFDDSYEGAKIARTMFKNNVDLGVSMSTFCDNSIMEEYHIVKLLGVDFTLDPAFKGTGLIQKNFSTNDLNNNIIFEAFSTKLDNEKYDAVNFNFSNCDIIDNRLDKYPVWNIPFDINGYKTLEGMTENYFHKVVELDSLLLDKENLKVFDEPSFDAYTKVASSSPQNFSLLKQLIIESNYPPYRRLNRRVEELIREVRGKSPDYIAKNKDVFFSFINDPIYNWIVKAFNSDKKVMLSIGLRLSKFVNKPSIIADADRKLESIKKRRNSQKGVLDKSTQRELNNVLRTLFGEIWKYIEEQSNTILLEKDTVKTMLNTFANKPQLNYKSIDAWLDAGADGQKDYKIWVDAFPYDSKDIEEYKKKKNFYGYPEVDKLITLLAEKAISQKDKDKLVEIMDKSNVNNFSENMDIQDNLKDKDIDSDITNRTMTDADITAFIEKLTADEEAMDKFVMGLQARGIIPGMPTNTEDLNMAPDGTPMDMNADPNQMAPINDGSTMLDSSQPVDMNQMPLNGNMAPIDPNTGMPIDSSVNNQMPPVDNTMGQQLPPDQQAGIPPMDNSAQAQPPMEGQIPPQINEDMFPKPKVISRDNATKLVGMSFSDIVRYSEANSIDPSVKRKIISFSVIDLMDPNMSKEDVALVWFSVGKPQGLTMEDVSDILSLKAKYFSGIINDYDYESLRQQLLLNIIK